jgi:hypothetical protein
MVVEGEAKAIGAIGGTRGARETGDVDRVVTVRLRPGPDGAIEELAGEPADGDCGRLGQDEIGARLEPDNQIRRDWSNGTADLENLRRALDHEQPLPDVAADPERRGRRIGALERPAVLADERERRHE